MSLIRGGTPRASRTSGFSIGSPPQAAASTTNTKPARRRYWNESYIQGTAYTRTPEYQLEQLKKQAEENQQKLEEMIKNSKFRANGEVNGKPAYYNPVTRQSLTADSDGKYKLRDW